MHWHILNGEDESILTLSPQTFLYAQVDPLAKLSKLRSQIWRLVKPSQKVALKLRERIILIIQVRIMCCLLWAILGSYISSNSFNIRNIRAYIYSTHCLTAPEIIEEAQAFPQSDIWSFGVLLYVLLSGQLPFKGENADESKDNILNVKFKFEYLYKEVTMEATRLIMWIFKRAPWYVFKLNRVYGLIILIYIYITYIIIHFFVSYLDGFLAILYFILLYSLVILAVFSILSSCCFCYDLSRKIVI